jgi:hypothetical protein
MMEHHDHKHRHKVLQDCELDDSSASKRIDHSNSSNGAMAKGDVAGTRIISSSTGISAFPWKLHDILEDSEREGFTAIVSWTMQGRAFRVHNHADFERTVMTRYFNHGKYKSFQRQLNIYGFQRVSSGDAVGSYTHKLFIRGRPDQCRYMVRTKIKRNGFGALSSNHATRNSGDKLVRLLYGSCHPPHIVDGTMNRRKDGSSSSLPNDSLLALLTGQCNSALSSTVSTGDEAFNHINKYTASTATTGVTERHLVVPDLMMIPSNVHCIEVSFQGKACPKLMDHTTKIEAQPLVVQQPQQHPQQQELHDRQPHHHQILGQRNVPRRTSRRRFSAEQFLQYSIALLQPQQQLHDRHFPNGTAPSQRRMSIRPSSLGGGDDDDGMGMDLDRIFDDDHKEEPSTQPAYYDPLALDAASPGWRDGGKIPTSMAEEMLRHILLS